MAEDDPEQPSCVADLPHCMHETKVAFVMKLGGQYRRISGLHDAPKIILGNNRPSVLNRGEITSTPCKNQMKKKNARDATIENVP